MKKCGEKVLEILIILFGANIILHSILYFIYKNELYIFLILFSLFMIGILVLILVFKYGDNDKNYNNYVVLDKLEYENLKKTLYIQKNKLNKQNKIIKTIIKDEL